MKEITITIDELKKLLDLQKYNISQKIKNDFGSLNFIQELRGMGKEFIEKEVSLREGLNEIIEKTKYPDDVYILEKYLK